jgi:hypothetical protein
MPTRFEDRSISSIAELLQALKELYGPTDTVWFRGHAEWDWQLVPSLAREERGIAAEETLIKRFKQNAAAFTLQPPTTEWEWLFLMQHYGAPTRLLDWSESPLVGLYFAVAAPSRPEKDGCLWCLEPIKLNQISNIEPVYEADIPCFGVDEVLNNYLPSTVVREQTSKLKPAGGIALRRFPRMSAQLGVFTITHRQQQQLDDLGDGQHLGRLIIPAEAKPNLLQELAHLRVTKLTLFPELESVATASREHIR